LTVGGGFRVFDGAEIARRGETGEGRAIAPLLAAGESSAAPD
jgi:hypothetical protein